MTLVRRPPGKGAWAPLLLIVPPQRTEQPRPMEWRIGQRVDVAGHPYRIAEVRP